MTPAHSDTRSQWQPIETAPRDGDTLFLVWGPHCDGQVVYFAPSTAPDLICADGTRFGGKEWCWAVVDGPTLHRDCVSHWMPLPLPPEVA